MEGLIGEVGTSRSLLIRKVWCLFMGILACYISESWSREMVAVE
jgi:hypothetical protein